jgi:hypothetical protein
MSAAELKEFLAAMELVRQANAAFSDVARNFVERDDDLAPKQDYFDEDFDAAAPHKSVTLH